MTAVQLTRADVGKPGLVEWLAAHDLEPHRVCALRGAELEIRDGMVHATVYVLDAHGHKQLDPDWTGPPLRQPVLVELLDLPLHAPLPDGLGTEIQ